MKRTVWALGSIFQSLLLVAVAASVPVVFINSSYIAGRFAAILCLNVSPELSGGKVLAQFSAPLDDDDGPGGYEYPLGGAYEKGELDITSYTVRFPLSRPAWHAKGAFWQLELTFAKATPNGLAGGGFRAPAVHIYIGIYGAASGSTESAFGEGELVRFDPDHPWDYVVSVDGWSPSGEIKSADGSYSAPVDTTWNAQLRRLTLRIGLDKAPALLSSVLAGKETWYYVLVGAYDGAREGHFAAVRKDANLHDGGGARDDDSPRVFDLLVPRGTSKSSELSSEDSGKGILALVEPVIVGGAEKVAQPDRAAALAEAKSAETRDAAERAQKIAALPSPSKADADIVGELFGLGLEERARAAVDMRLATDAHDPLALAYRGALVALSASRASGLGEKMSLVAAAYRDLDAAAGGAAAFDPKERIAVLLCRGNVSSAVPNDVFGRAAQGAADFDAARLLAKGSGDAALENDCLAKAALAFEKAGRTEEASARWATLAGKESLDPRLRLELIDRGY
jgi:hypothetical protein